MAILVEDVGAKLSLESLLEYSRLDGSLLNEEFNIGSIARTVSAKLRKHQIVNLEGTKPKTPEASRSQVDQPRSVPRWILRNRYAVKVDAVLARNFATLTGYT